jgi:3-phenylpropionate/cinnamic acid dioxygenase small subunit
MTVNYATAAIDKTSVMRGLVSIQRVPLGSEVYNRLLETLYDEAAALDERRFDDWVAYLEQDLVYTAPLRLTRNGPNKDRDVVRTMKHFDENYASILMRTGRLSKSAWAEDPPSRTRRFVTNVRIAQCDTAGEYEVVSYLYVERSRFDNPDNESITAERRDVWRLVDGAYKLAVREIIVDQSTLGMSNFAIFL